MTENGNGYKTLKITFWIFAVIVFPCLFFIGSNVIANDKFSAQERSNLKEMLYSRLGSIDNRLTRIETKLRINE